MRHRRDIEHIRGLLETKPADTRLWLKLAQLLEGIGDSKAAAAAFARVAQCYVDDGLLLKAAATQKHALRLEPKAIDARLALARIYADLGSDSDAIAQYRILLTHFAFTGDGESVANVLVELAKLGASAPNAPI